MPDYVAFSTSFFIRTGLASGLHPGGPGPPTAWVLLVPRAASPPGCNLGACTEHINCHLMSESFTARSKALIGDHFFRFSD